MYKLYEDINCANLIGEKKSDGDLAQTYLTRYYHKYNAASLHLYSLQSQNKPLVDENKYLKDQLKEYLFKVKLKLILILILFKINKIKI